MVEYHREDRRDNRLMSLHEAGERPHYVVNGSVYYIDDKMRKIAVDHRAAVRKKEDTLAVVSELIAESIRGIADRDYRILRDVTLPIPHIKEIRWQIWNTKKRIIRKGETVWLHPERDPPVSIQSRLHLCVDEALRYHLQKIREGY